MPSENEDSPKTLSQEHIEKIMSLYWRNEPSKPGNGDNEKPALEKQLDKTFEIFSARYEAFARGTHLTYWDVNKADSDYRFIEALKEVVKEEQWTPVERNILLSDAMTLHYLVVHGGLNHIYQKHISSQYYRDHPNEYPETEEDKIKLKAQLAQDIMVRQRKKDKEAWFAEKMPDAPTLGMEYEVLSFLPSILQETRRAQIEITMIKMIQIGQYEKVRNLVIDTSFEHLFMELMLEPDDELATRLHTCNETLTLNEAILTLPFTLSGEETDQSPVRGAIREVQIARLQKKLAELEKRNPNDPTLKKYTNTLALLEGRMEIAEGTCAYTDLDFDTLFYISRTRESRLSVYAGRDSHPDQSAEEFVTRPAYSMRMHLKDFVYASLMGALVNQNEVNVHVNIGGVWLDPEHTDFMEVSAIAVAAGYPSLGNEITDVRIAQLIETTPNYLPQSNYPKRFTSGGKVYEYPYHAHKTNASHGIQSYGPHTEFVELRCLYSFYSENFPGFVRFATFAHLAAFGEQAAQKPKDERNNTDKALAQAWAELQSKWCTLLEEKGVYQPSPEERYSQWETQDGKMVQTRQSKFGRYILDIALAKTHERADVLGMDLTKKPDELGDTEASEAGKHVGVDVTLPKSSLQSKTRELIREYDATVKRILFSSE